MLNTKIPVNKYNTTTYPNLDPQYNGQCIAVLWGHKHGIVPVCVDTIAGTWKICDKTKAGRDALDSIEEIKADDIALVSGADFTPDLVNGEFALQASPYLAANTRYYFAFEAAYALSGVNNIYTAGSDADEGYDGDAYYINSADVWTIDPAGKSIGFNIYGKEAIDGAEESQVWFSYVNPAAFTLRDAEGHTRIGQSFMTGAHGFYVTKLHIGWGRNGTPDGTFSVKLYSAIAPEVRVGPDSSEEQVGTVDPALPIWHTWHLRGTPNKILIQATGPPNNGGAMDQVGDIIEDAYENCLGGSVVNDFVGADFTSLKAVKTEQLGIYLDSEITFNEFIQTLEVGQLFKFLPTLTRKYTVKFGAAGDTSVAHFYDEDFLSFKSKRNWKAIFGIIKLKWGEDPEKQEWATETHTSTIADYIYKNTETLTLETKLMAQADATVRAADYGTLLEYPVRTITFEVSCGAGFSLMPMDKVKITRRRGDNAGGSFNGVLFCILEVNKNMVEGTALITAILDTQTYV